MNTSIYDPAFWSRLQFGFTLTYHYLFPQLTMGLAWFIVYFKWRALSTGNEKYNQAVRFWAKIFGLNFAVGVVTGIPMEFQFGTNWADFSKYAGGVIGQTLAMEGMFAFFLESAFVGALIWGEKRLGPRYHFLAAMAVALGSWLSGYFILVTNAFMQHPVGHQAEANGTLGITSLSAYLLNPWALIQFTHNQMAALVTGSFVVAAVGAFYALRGVHQTQARLYLRAGTFTALIASFLVAFPTGDQQAKMVGRHQPVTLAAMEGKFNGGPVAGVAVIGQPNLAARRLDNPIEVPGALSFLAYGTFQSYVRGLDEFPAETWPDNVELLYYSFQRNAQSDSIKLRQLTAFIFWTSWAASTNRPNDKITYTSNFPSDPMVGNVPTSSAIVWTGVSVIMLIAGIGAILMEIVLSLLPIGLLQTYQSVSAGYWSARSAEFMQTPLMQTLRWVRIFGDTVFALGALSFVYFVLTLVVTRRRSTAKIIDAVPETA